MSQSKNIDNSSGKVGRNALRYLPILARWVSSWMLLGPLKRPPSSILLPQILTVSPILTLTQYSYPQNAHSSPRIGFFTPSLPTGRFGLAVFPFLCALEAVYAKNSGNVDILRGDFVPHYFINHERKLVIL